MIYIDTNIILRYLLQDCEKYNKKSIEIVEQNKVFIKNEVMAEVVYVLNKTYNIPKKELTSILLEFADNENIYFDSKNIIKLSLKFFGEKNIDFVDSILYSLNKIENKTVMSFDKKLNKYLEAN